MHQSDASVSPDKNDAYDFDNPVRPLSFDEYVGQTKLKTNLLIFIKASKERALNLGYHDLDHLLFFGPPGLGKTTLASIIAKELGVNIKITSGPSIEKAGDIAALLSAVSNGDIIFIDEIHRLPKPAAEMLYPAMEDFKLDIIIGEGATAKSIRINLPRFTLIGATTRAGLIPSPLRDRFGFTSRLEYYETDELADIVIRSARLYGIGIENDAAFEIASRSRGTPRIANRLLRRLRDYMVHLKKDRITAEVAKFGIESLGIDNIGLDGNDKLFLRTIIDKFGGGPVGIDTIAQAINDEKGTLEDVVEPYLVSCGFIMRTKKGRIATELAYKHFGLAKGDSLP
ncbi:Holliday junction branch migration DNA helicase RuvB [Candidatus Acidulodesulfobacterium sp. H_13]|uniref:Holliday junction branch migration DNA helicase RuvB n=1 Tax=Candidatus Acidulodesulfobacterium sp. H_13 TaxID=3395470 RepID=UPI003AF5A868